MVNFVHVKVKNELRKVFEFVVYVNFALGFVVRSPFGLKGDCVSERVIEVAESESFYVCFYAALFFARRNRNDKIGDLHIEEVFVEVLRYLFAVFLINSVNLRVAERRAEKVAESNFAQNVVDNVRRVFGSRYIKEVAERLIH